MNPSEPLVHGWCAETSPRGYLYHAVRVPDLLRVILEKRSLTQWFFVERLIGRFHGSMLGPLWVLIHPVFMFAVYFLVFGVVFNRWGEGADQVLYALYLFSGLMIYQGVAAATNGGLGSVLSDSNLIKKVAFPSQILPVVPAFVEAAVSVVGMVLALLIGILTGRVVPGWELLLLPWFLVVLVSLVSGMSLLLATVNVFVRDVKNIWAVFTTAWFFLSPNFWPPSFIADLHPWALDLMGLNPIYHLLIAARQILGLVDPAMGIEGGAVHNMLIATAWAAGFLVVGYSAFMTHREKFPDLAA